MGMLCWSPRSGYSTLLTTLPSSSSSSSCSPLFLSRVVGRPPSPYPSRYRRPLLRIHIEFEFRFRAVSCSSCSYNGWADLAAEPDLPFALPLPQPTTTHALLLLLLLPLAALSISRLPPLPLLAAAFTAGFAARHLSPAASSPQPHRLTAVLADLDAQVGALKDRLASGADSALLLQALDRVRDAVGEAARLAHQPSSSSSSNTTASETLPPVLGVLGDVAKELAHHFGGLARETVRDLTSPRKIRAKEKVAAAVTTVDANKPDAQVVVDKGNNDAAAAAAAAQQDDGNNLLDSRVDDGTEHSTAQDIKSSSSMETERALDMLPYGSDDAGFSAPTNEEDRLERLVFNRKHGRRSATGMRSDPFEGGGLATESMESSLLERTLEIRDRSYRVKIERRNGENQASEAQGRLADHFVGNAASSGPTDDERAAKDSGDEEFSHNVKEAAGILMKARECMMARADEETADALLYKSARLLSTAVALRPTSLVAVGQLGNTYLLHGELKLKLSRELRTLLANSRAFINGRERVSRSSKLDRGILSRDNISSALVDVCEECESLLVEAGRSYRMALSIDSGDVKALYNWGLALIFRAQLLADIGPEAAVDADRVYLAAIDKFDAMLSKSNTYAPEALYRWGTALQQRSHLRSRNNKEKIRLLEQAKGMFEDVLYVEADNKMVREALSACISELNYHGRWL